MKEHKKKILELFKNGLKAKEISEKINVEYAIVRGIIKNEQARLLYAKDDNDFAKKARANASKRYEEKKDEINAKLKEDRKKNPEKYRLKRQKEKAKDPEGFNAKKRANWAKHKIRNRPRVNKRTNELHHEKKEIVYTHYSKKLSNSDVSCCNCCGYVGIKFLTVDHIIPKREMEKDPKMIEMGFKAKRTGHPLNQWLITNNFPKGFQILCWNCNFAKGVLGKCPHQK